MSSFQPGLNTDIGQQHFQECNRGKDERRIHLTVCHQFPHCLCHTYLGIHFFCYTVQHPAQRILQGGQVGVASAVYHIVKPCIPLANHLPEGYGGQHRLGDRQDDPEKDMESIGPVYAGRFLHPLINREKVISDNNTVKHRKSCGQYIHPEIVQQIQVFHVQVSRDHAAADEHGDYEKRHNRPTERNLRMDQGVCCHTADDYMQESPYNRPRH